MSSIRLDQAFSEGLIVLKMDVPEERQGKNVADEKKSCPVGAHRFWNATAFKNKSEIENEERNDQ